MIPAMRTLPWLALLLVVAACNSPPQTPLDGPGPAIDGHGDGGRSDGVRPDAGVVDGHAEASAGDLPACGTPKPFVPPTKTEPWRHSLTTPLVVLSGPANHRGQDVLAVAGTSPVLIGKFAYGTLDTNLQGEDVEIYLQDQPPCGDWVSLGVFTTSTKNQYGTQYGISDDGGRVFFKMPPGHAQQPGRYPVRMVVKGDLSIAAFALIVLAPSTSTVVLDIDGTLTTDDFQLVTQLFAGLLAGTYSPKLQAGGVDVASAWASKGYQLVYLTGRPDQLRNISQAWLVQQGFPPGAVHLTDTLAQALPTSTGVAAYKTDFLKRITSEAQVSLQAAYGNATTDIEAYANAAVPKTSTFIIGAQGGTQGTVAVKDYPSHLPTVQAMPAAKVAAPPPLAGW